jgi:hypothetical protein
VSDLKVAIVSRDPSVRLEAARAFDAAPPSWFVRLYEEEPRGADVVVWGPDVMAGEGLVFDPMHPERVLDEIAVLVGRGRVTAVTGGGRGVGVTTVGVHLAAAWAEEFSTCFVDLDHSCGAAHRLGLADALSGVDRPDDIRLAAVPVTGGFRLLSGHGSPDGGEDLVGSAVDAFERVVVDVPDGAEEVGIVRRAENAVIVVTPSPTSISRAQTLLDSCECTRSAIVLNRLGPGGELDRSALERRLGHRIAIEFPCTPALRDCEETFMLLPPRFVRWSRRLERLCRALEDD